eukprot:Awhi_evm1s1929
MNVKLIFSTISSIFFLASKAEVATTPLPADEYHFLLSRNGLETLRNRHSRLFCQPNGKEGYFSFATTKGNEVIVCFMKLWRIAGAISELAGPMENLYIIATVNYTNHEPQCVANVDDEETEEDESKHCASFGSLHACEKVSFHTGFTTSLLNCQDLASVEWCDHVYDKFEYYLVSKTEEDYITE